MGQDQRVEVEVASSIITPIHPLYTFLFALCWAPGPSEFGGPSV